MSRSSDRCSVPSCRELAQFELEAVPSGHIRNEQIRFGFCRGHVDEYVRGGYKLVGETPGQGRLMA